MKTYNEVFHVWDVQDMGCLIYGIFGTWDLQYMDFSLRR